MAQVTVPSVVPRKPNKPKRGQVHRVHVLLSGEMLEAIDRMVADQSLTGEGPGYWLLPTVLNRTQVIRGLLYDGLKKRGLLK